MTFQSPIGPLIFVASVAVLAAISMAACGSGGGDSGVGNTGVGNTGGSVVNVSNSNVVPSPSILGAHAYVSQGHGAGTSPVTTNSVTTEVSGSTFVVAAGAYPSGTIQSISDSKGNVYSAVDSRIYWDNRAEAKLWVCQNCVGGANHTWSITKAPGQTTNEVTLFVVEVKTSVGLRSWSVKNTATGLDCADIPGVLSGELLVSVVFGDGTIGPDNFTPGAGFLKQDEEQAADSNHIQGASAAATISSDGTYGCNWTTTGNSGSEGKNPIRWLLAI